MNNITKRNRILGQLESFTLFLPECHPDARPRLIMEMNRLVLEIERIKRMGLSDLQKQIIEYYDTKESQFNFTEVHHLQPEQHNGKRTA
jgi:hypothetical protein